ncbi:MAG TPA: ABC-2 family transporter protein [Candidatus Sulfotelmatobacter sp.]|jgi:ABC-2 type transport system permease protein|nr:ABC-2 family transporter protein [Candidatus Sulfotelmatobacter sp.]
MIAIMNQYIRVYKTFLRLNILKLFVYRADLFSSIIAHTIWSSFTIIQMLLLTSKTSYVFGWSRNDLLVLAAMYNIVYSFFYMFFSRGFGEFSTTIHVGRLDGVLIKPISSQFLMTTLYITYTHGIRLILGIGFLVYMLSIMHVHITLLLMVGFMFIIFFSVMIIYSYWMLIMTLTIWFPKLSNLSELLYQVNSVAKFPQEIYKGASVYLLLTLFPLTLIVVTPVKYLLQKAFFSDILLLVIFACGMVFFSHFFWKFALRFYTSASA